MRQYEFDFNEAAGDTIREKCESLYQLILKINETSKVRFAISGPELRSLLEVTHMASHNVFASMGIIDCIHILLDDVYSLQCFKSNHAAKDEIVLFGSEENVVVKVINLLHE